MNNLQSSNNLFTASIEWNEMDNDKSRNESKNTSNNNIQEPTIRLPSRALPQNNLGDGMNNQHEAVNIANINRMNINYNRLGGQSDTPNLDKLHPPMSPNHRNGKVGDAANYRGHNVVNLETDGELEGPLPSSTGKPWATRPNLTGSITLLAPLPNESSPPIRESYPYANMRSTPKNAPTNETNVPFLNKTTFKDHKNAKTGSRMPQYYPNGYMGSYSFSGPSSLQSPQDFFRSTGNAYTNNGFTPETTQNSFSNNKDYSYTNGQTNSQRLAAQFATTSNPGEVESMEPPRYIPNAIVIKNIPFDVRKEQLQVLMKDLKLPSPYAFNYHFDNEGFFRGLAFANFHDDWEATEAIKVLHGYVIRGRALKVEHKVELKTGVKENVEREKRMKRGQLLEQHKPVPPDKIGDLPRLLTSEFPIPDPMYSKTPGQEKQNDVPLQRLFAGLTLDYTASGDDRQTSAVYPQRQAPLRQPQGPPSLQGSQSPSWRPIREQAWLTGQHYGARPNQYGIIGDRMARPLGGTAPSQVATTTNSSSGPSAQQNLANVLYSALTGTQHGHATAEVEYDTSQTGSSDTQIEDLEEM